jgi:hypothetical protein
MADAAPSLSINDATDKNLPEVLVAVKAATAPIHKLLDDAEAAFHELFDGHIEPEVKRFDAFLSQVRMVIDQAADMAPKDKVEADIKAALQAAKDRGMV